MTSNDVSCPECQKQIKAKPELQGKKVRCKGCGHIFVIPAATEARPAAKVATTEDLESYGLAADKDEGVLRCAHCAKELESADAVICLHCGYNMRTRQRVATVKVEEITPGDRLMWLLPGFLCLVGIVLLIGFDLFYCLVLPKKLVKSDWEFVTYGGIRLWVVIFTIFIMIFLGRFAVRRLIFQPTPPEQERRV
ncbi:MAG: hypothetical protein JNM56_37870 [Planctomycetia bacterium]|nr:hypothetical protein [Planctomycetia bacterium]